MFEQQSWRLGAKSRKFIDNYLYEIMNNMPQQCKTLLEQHYRRQFQGLVLYGSYARQEATTASDIDLLVLLKPPFDYFHEIRDLADLLYPLQLESEQLLSVKPADVEEFRHGALQLYRNILREGIEV